MTFPVNEQNVSVMRIDINALSLSLDLNIFSRMNDPAPNLEWKQNMNTSSKEKLLSQIWVICELLPFVMVGQYSPQYTLAWFMGNAWYGNTSSRGTTDTIPSEVFLKNFLWIQQDQIVH